MISSSVLSCRITEKDKIVVKFDENEKFSRPAGHENRPKTPAFETRFSWPQNAKRQKFPHQFEVHTWPHKGIHHSAAKSCRGTANWPPIFAERRAKRWLPFFTSASPQVYRGQHRRLAKSGRCAGCSISSVSVSPQLIRLSIVLNNQISQQ
jgi:hypothetical protein